MNTNNRSQCDVVHHFAEVFKSLSDYKREREKNNWLCFALPVKTRERMRGFLPSSISFLAWWQLYKSLWNNCVFLIKCEGVAISMLGFGADVLSAFKDVSVRLICAPVHRVGAVTQAWGDSYRQTGVNTGPWLEEKDLGDGSAVIECSVYCVITGCSVIFHAWLWHWSALEWGWRPYRGRVVSMEVGKHHRRWADQSVPLTPSFSQI